MLKLGVEPGVSNGHRLWDGQFMVHISASLFISVTPGKSLHLSESYLPHLLKGIMDWLRRVPWWLSW